MYVFKNTVVARAHVATAMVASGNEMTGFCYDRVERMAVDFRSEETRIDLRVRKKRGIACMTPDPTMRCKGRSPAPKPDGVVLFRAVAVSQVQLAQLFEQPPDGEPAARFA